MPELSCKNISRYISKH